MPPIPPSPSVHRITLQLAHTPPLTLPIQHPADILDAFAHLLTEPRETAYAIYLDAANRVIGYIEVSAGSLLTVSADPATIACGALLSGASAVCLLHTHPTGTAAPSAADRALTQHLVNALDLLGIMLTDHLILAPNHTSFSFHAAGELPQPTVSPTPPSTSPHIIAWTPVTPPYDPIAETVLLTPLTAIGAMCNPLLIPQRTASLSCTAFLRRYPILRTRETSSPSPRTP